MCKPHSSDEGCARVGSLIAHSLLLLGLWAGPGVKAGNTHICIFHSISIFLNTGSSFKNYYYYINNIRFTVVAFCAAWNGGGVL